MPTRSRPGSASTGTRHLDAHARRRSSAQALDEHLDAMLAQGAPPPAVPMDKNLVASVRDMLVAYPLEYRIFSRLKRAQIGADIPPFTRGRRGRAGVAAACSSAPAASR